MVSSHSIYSRILQDRRADVDIALLSFNGIDVTRKFIERLYDSTDIGKFNLIWVDNGSSDGTVDFLKLTADKYDNISLVLNSENVGVIDGRNQSFSMLADLIHTPSNNLMFLDNDQYVREGWLEQHFAVLNHGYDVVGVEAWQMSPRFLPIRKIEKVGEWFSYVGCGGALIRKKVTDAIGLYDPQFNPSYFEDPDFCARAVAAGFKVGWNARAKITHLPHQTLGKLGGERERRFLSSHAKFKAKWSGKPMPVLTQPDLAAFR